jgi:chorismate mutase
MAGLDFSGNKELEKARDFIAMMEDVIIPYVSIRSRYLKNDIVYQPGGIKIKGHEGSYFDYLFHGSQKLHAKAGRFTQAGEVSFFGNLPEPVAERETSEYLLGDSKININDFIISMYLGQLNFLCEPGECKNYGSAVFADIHVLDSTSTRITRGGIEVYDAKRNQYPKEFTEAAKIGGVGARAALMELLTDHPQEIKVLNRVREKAINMGMKNPDFVHDMFTWVIPFTKEVQIKRALEVYERGLYV